MTFETIAKRPRVVQQLTGLTRAAFETVLDACRQAYHDERQQRDPARPTPRRRRHGGGRQGALPTPADKLAFLLVSFRHDPTQETRAFLCGFSPGPACQWVHRRTPILNRALGPQAPLPARQPAELHEVQEACAGLELILEATERPIRRPKDSPRRRDDDSGQKERQTPKDIVITDQSTGKVTGLGPTQAGRTHDTACLDEEGYTSPGGSTVSKDSGFPGSAPDGVTTPQPQKKPRGTALTPAEQEAHRLICRVRVNVEHSIGGVKVFRIVPDLFGTLKAGFADLVMETVCGGSNLRVESRAAP